MANVNPGKLLRVSNVSLKQCAAKQSSLGFLENIWEEGKATFHLLTQPFEAGP